MKFLVSRGGCAALCGALLTACLFPEYTFDEPEPSGGGGAGTGGEATGATGGGGASGGGGAAGGEGGMGGMPPVEDCFTAGDEDDNGTADCADPACAPDLECVDAIPVGWGTYGYVTLFRGSPSADPECPPGTTMEVYAGNGNLLNADAECTSCSCGAPMGQGCAFLPGPAPGDDFDPGKAGLQPFYTRNTPCGMNATAQTTLTVPDAWDLTCSDLDSATGGQTCSTLPCNTSVQAQAASVTPGTCTPGGGLPSGGDPSWGEGVKACRSVANLQGCDSGLTCVPRPPTPYEPRVCIGKVGDQTCPAGAFTLRSEAFGGFDDSRDCSDCTCGASTGGTCKITLSLYDDATNAECVADATPIATVESGTCANLSGNPAITWRSAEVTTLPSGGSCAVTGGGVPSGEVTPSSPTTFCCLP